MKYILYRTDGSHEIINREARMEYEDLSKFSASGMIEFSGAFENANGATIMIDEEGLLNNAKANPFFTPLYQEFFSGDVLEGKIDAEGEFVGFSDEEELVIREVKTLSPELFVKDKVFTLIGIGGFIANTTRTEVKATGEAQGGNPIFKENKKGARKLFTLRNLKEKDVMIFEGTDLPFKVDGEVSHETHSGFMSRTMRGNALYNLCGDIDEIREYTKTKNINPFFTQWDRINHVQGDLETLVFMDKFASCKLVADRQTAQHQREGSNVKVGEGFAVASI